MSSPTQSQQQANVSSNKGPTQQQPPMQGGVRGAVPPQQQPTHQPQQAPATGGGIPYVGSKISLISKADIRYEGTLFNIDAMASTVALKDVLMFGTENRRETDHIPPSDRLYNYIVFKGSDIKDLTVCEPPKPAQPVLPQAGYPPYNQPYMGMGHPSQYPYGNYNPYFYGPGAGGVHQGVFYPPQNQGAFYPPNQQQAQAQQQQQQPPYPYGVPPQHANIPPQHQQQQEKPSSPTALNQQQPSMDQPFMEKESMENQSAEAISSTHAQQNQRRTGGSGAGSKTGGYNAPNRRTGGNRPSKSSGTDKAKFDEEFNFETMKSLDKEDILKEIKEKSHHGEDDEDEAAGITSAYNKESSFFDSLSTDNADKTAGKRMSRIEREEQKKLNMETFGESGSDRGGGYRRGGRGGRGRGGISTRGGSGSRGGRGGGRGGGRFGSDQQ